MYDEYFQIESSGEVEIERERQRERNNMKDRSIDRGRETEKSIKDKTFIELL